MNMGKRKTPVVLQEEPQSKRNKNDVEEYDASADTLNELENDLDIKLTNVLGIEHAMTTLRNSILKIINDAPDYDQLMAAMATTDMEDTLKKEVFIALSRTNSVKMASKLKKLYNEGNFPLFDYILNLDDSKSLELGSYNIKFTSGSNLDLITNESKAIYHEKPYPPALPKIKNPIILSKVFMHKSVVNDKRYLSNQQLLDSHNERLEFLGDSILNNLVTLIIFKAFPDYNEGELSRLRIELVNNQTLTNWSKLYDFDKELRKNISDSAFNSGKMKVYADVFEAYVGGLVSDGVGMQEISDWLQNLADPVLTKFRLEKDLAEVKPLNKNAKLELYSLIGCAAMAPRYVTVQSGDGMVLPFIVTCLMKDEELGRGEGQNIKEAGLRLAMVLLENKSLMEKFSLLRRQMPRSVSVIRRPDDAELPALSPSPSMDTTTTVSDTGLPPLPQTDPTSSSEDLSDLPICVPQFKEHSIDIQSKGRLYGLLTKRKLHPEYDTEKLKDGKVKVMLSINSIPFVYCIHKSGKLAGQSAAQYLLEHSSLLKEFGVIDELPL